MWPLFAAQAGASILGHIFGREDQEDAEQAALDAAYAARQSANNKQQQTENRATNAVTQGQNQANNQINAGYNETTRHLEYYDSAFDASAASSLSMSQQAAAMEREIAIQDQEEQLLRMRESAELAGFNPLTVLEAGYYGAPLPTGILSPDYYQQDHAIATGFYSGQSSNYVSLGQTKMGLETEVALAGITGKQNAIALGMDAYNSSFDSIMAGHELALSAGGQAYDQTASMWEGIGTAAGNAANYSLAVADQQLAQSQLDLQNQQFAFDQEQFAYEREFNAQQLQAYSSGGPVYANSAGRSPGGGSSLIASTGGASLSPGGTTIQAGGVSVPLQTSTYTEQRLTDAGLASTNAEIVAGIADAPATVVAVDNIVKGWGEQLWSDAVTGFNNGTSPLGRAYDSVRDAWSNPPAVEFEYVPLR